LIAALLDHLWQSTLFAGAIALSMPLFRRQPAALRFWLWFAASMKFLFPFAPLVLVGRHILAAMTPAALEPVLAVLRPATASLAVIAVPLATPAPSHLPAMDLAAIVWAAGLLTLALVCLSRWLDLRATLRNAEPVAMAAPVPVRSAPSFIEPGLVGIFRPVILLPVGLSRHLSPDEMDAVLAHELCHLRRHDNLLAALHMLVEGLFWFHPLVWWIGTRLCEERERACDESVVAGGVRPLVYAEGILKTCRFYVQTPLACASGVSGADLKLRLGAIMTEQPAMALSPAKGMLLLMMGALTLALPLSAGLLGIAPVSKIASHVASVLSRPVIPAPVLTPAPPQRHVVLARPRRHRAAEAASASLSAPTEASPLVHAPAIRIETVLDTHLPAIPVPVTAKPEDAIVCRKAEPLTTSRLTGPQVCLYSSRWEKLRADGLDVGPDGKSLVRTDYEKQKTLAASPCVSTMTAHTGASTGWVSGAADCF